MRVKYFAATLALASVLPVGQAVANYEACMKFCVAEHRFSHCNLQCGLAGGEKKVEEDESEGIAIETVEVEACDTLDDKGSAIYYLIKERIGYPLMAYYPTDRASVISVEFYPPGGEKCHGIATFSGNCNLTLEFQCESADGAK